MKEIRPDHKAGTKGGNKMKLIITVERTRRSTTQGEAIVKFNDTVVARFGDKIDIVDGEWKSVIPDKDFIMSTLYHKHDNIYNVSEKAKEFIKNYNEEQAE